LHPFSKPEHPIRELLVNLFSRVRIIRIRMVAVVKLNNVKTATVHVKVDVPLLKIWRDGFPDSHFRVYLFDSTRQSRQSGDGSLIDSPHRDQ
ncbi:MAG: hypothetical protein K6G71_00805, partial [Clostridiales bacterium]|nr:hypothetical protein [Clostridiales bacterium]